MSATIQQTSAHTTREQRLTLTLVCFGSFMSPFTMAAVNIAIPSIAADLNADAASIAWLPTLFLLTNVALLLPFSKLADNYGRKRVYLCGLAFSIVASLCALIAPTIELILFSRMLQGVSSAMLFGSSLAIITSAFPSTQRGLPLGLNTASIYLGLTVAPAVGGWVTETIGWRMVFFIPIPLAIGLLFIGLVFIKGDWKRDTHSTFDLLGTCIFACWATTFVVGFTYLPELKGLSLLAFSLVLMCTFIFQQSRQSSPLIRVQLFRNNRMFSFSLLTAFLMYAGNYPLTFMMSLYLQYIRGLSPAESGQILLAQAVAMAMIAPFAGKLSDKVQPRTLTTLGCITAALGYVFLTQLNENTAVTMISLSLFLTGVGFGLFSSPNHNAVMSSVDHKDVGVASASLNLARVCGNIFAMSLINSLIHIFIGRELISEKNYPELMHTLDIGLTIALGFITLAALLSANRGKKAAAMPPQR